MYKGTGETAKDKNLFFSNWQTRAVFDCRTETRCQVSLGKFRQEEVKEGSYPAVRSRREKLQSL